MDLSKINHDSFGRTNNKSYIRVLKNKKNKT